MLTSLLLAMKVMFTGVVLLVPSQQDPHLVRVVVPNGRMPGIPRVPPHFAYVMFRIRDLDPAGRKPDIHFMGGVNGNIPVGVVFIDKEHLALSGSFESTPLCEPTASSFGIAGCTMAAPHVRSPFPEVREVVPVAFQDSLHWLYDFRHSDPDIATKIQDDVLRSHPTSGNVALRMNLTSGKMTVVPKSFDLRYAYRVRRNGMCQAVARMVAVTMNETGYPSNLVLTSTSFDGASANLPLKLTATAGDLEVLIGNEALDHIEHTVDLFLGTPGSSEQHEDTTDHMRILGRLFQNGTVLTTPGEIPAGACQNGDSPDVPDGSAGGGGTCNPSGMPAKDPAAIDK